MVEKDNLITEISFSYPGSVGNDYFILRYKCAKCGKIEKEYHTNHEEDYHKMADSFISEHLDMHSYSELGEKFEDIIKIVKGIK